MLEHETHCRQLTQRHSLCQPHYQSLRHPLLKPLIVALSALAVSSFCVSSVAAAEDTPPAQVFDLTTWKLTLPMDADGDDEVDEISVGELQSYQHPDYYYLNDNNHLVFVTPNSAFTTPNSSNARTELRQMLAGADDAFGPKAPEQNFALASHPEADRYAQIGGYLDATLRVDHVAERTDKPDRAAAYSVVIGQIHAGKDEAVLAQDNGFGHGNEPLKIYYKKFPDHETSSVFWNYERNLEKDDPERIDISHAVWGNDWSGSEDPGEAGIALGESFRYRVEVKDDVMHLTFASDGHPTRTFEQNLADNVGPDGEVDEADHPQGYAGDWMYFKAGSYNQCNTKPESGACLGTGVWETDQQHGDYAQVVFSELDSGPVE